MEGKALEVILGVFVILLGPRNVSVELRAFEFELVPDGEVGFGQEVAARGLTLTVAWELVLVVGSGLAVGEGSDG